MMRCLLTTVLALALAVVAGPVLAQGKADGVPERATARTVKKSTYGQHFMVVAANPLAARAGVAMLEAGGSAADAAIAVQLVLNLVEPQSSGIGGGAFALYWQAKARRLVTYDGRETAPLAATPDLFRDAGKLLPYATAVRTGRAVGVPGTVALLWRLHQKHGRLPWARLFAPAIRLAEAGFAVSPRLHGLLRHAFFLRRRVATRAYFFTAEGDPLPVGFRRNNKPFAATLRLIARDGPRAFYRGPVAQDIVAAVKADRPWPGGLRPGDLGRYKVVSRAPICASYRAWQVCGMGPPSSGGIAVAQILGQLARFDLARMPPMGPKALHLLIESSRLAFADRNRYVADTNFIEVPVARMLAPDYLRRRSMLIDPAKAGGRAQPGQFVIKKGALPVPGHSLEIPATSHISIVDGEGNALSMTTTIEAGFGSGIMVRGFLLNNELTDFSFRRERGGRPVANRVQGGKRPRSSMAPTMVFGRTGRLMLVAGSPGGSRIIGYVTLAIVAILDWRMTAQSAADLPHVLSRNGPVEVENGAPAALVTALRALGHKVRQARMTSGLHLIRRLADGRLEGATDPRREGMALGK